MKSFKKILILFSFLGLSFNSAFSMDVAKQIFTNVASKVNSKKIENVSKALAVIGIVWACKQHFDKMKKNNKETFIQSSGQNKLLDQENKESAEIASIQKEESKKRDLMPDLIDDIESQMKRLGISDEELEQARNGKLRVNSEAALPASEE
jgi:hypothetical protein